MSPEWIVGAGTLLLAALSPILAWWGSTRYFVGRWEAQQAASLEWRKIIDERLKELEATMRENSFAALVGRVQRAEKDILDLREWKHLKADPYIGAMDALKDRVERLEDK